MKPELYCPNGHTWESTSAASVCPICGSTAESHRDDDCSTWGSVSVDELPPPPSGLDRLFVLEPRERVPQIPGFQLVRELGRGGMGVVYEAQHLGLKRCVALKVIRGGTFAAREELARFRMEAEAIARFQHPNIVQIFEVGESEGLPFLALEFVNGGNLSALLRSSPMAARRSAELVRTLALAVQHAHNRGVIHRDLKPANVLLQVELAGADSARSEPGTPKIGDFGLAKFGESPNRSSEGLIVGTPAYMAPEQASGQGDLVGPPADVWALGAILYECLTGRPPFLGKNSIETIQQVINLEPDVPSRFVSGVTRDLETICLKCLQKDPEKRYRTAGDLADDLERFLDGRPVLARRTSWPRRGAMWCRRRPAAAAFFVVVLLAGTALAWLGLRRYQDLETFNVELTSRNEIITRNNDELALHNLTITRQSRDLRTANDKTTTERDRAEYNLLFAIEAVVQMLSDMGLSRVAHIPHIDKTRSKMLDEALRLFDRLAVFQEADPRLRLAQALTLQRSGNILTLLQRFKDAEAQYEKALKTIHDHRNNANDGTSADSYLFVEALTHLDRGRMYLQSGRMNQGKADFDKALELIGRRTVAPETDLKFLVAVGNANLAVVELESGNPDEAILYLGRSRQFLEELFVEDSKDIAYVGAYAFVLNSLGVAALRMDEVEWAVELFEQARDACRLLLEKVPENIDYRATLGRSLGNLGLVLVTQGFLRRAERPIADALAIREELAKHYPEVGHFQVELCRSYLQFGNLCRARSENEVAVDWFTRGIDRLKSVENRQIPSGTLRRVLGDTHRARAESNRQLKRQQEAIRDLVAAIEQLPKEEAELASIELSILLVDGGEVGKGIEIVESLLDAPGEVSGEIYFGIGRVFARAASQTKDPENSETLRVRAVRSLEESVRSGFFRDPARRRLLDQHPDWKPFHGRSDFESLRIAIRS